MYDNFVNVGCKQEHACCVVQSRTAERASSCKWFDQM